ncbi:MAG: phosphoribosylanthranilate isomerase [Thermaerobacter sp.]|nr:phosphoribosylanthranilate isomerase [Thermaerobacter sp.]
MAMTSVKICGVRDPDTASYCFAAGADFVGLVLTTSRRQIGLDDARRILQTVAGRFVAVMKDVDGAQLEAVCRLPFYAVQIHGTAPVDWIERVHSSGQVAIATAFREDADIVLLDGEEPGSGRGRDWERPLWPRPIWLAGGLNPGNVRQVVRRLRPDGVDVSSGVERDGAKERDLVRRFMEEVRHGDDETGA